MADVRDRAQLILITGLILAVSFVVLTLLLNTVIYTENLASRGVDTGGSEAIEYQTVVVHGLGELVDGENDAEHQSQSEVRERVENGTSGFNETVTASYLERGVVADVSNLSLDDGRLLRQTDPSRAFTNRTGTANWTLATGVEDTRSFVVTVSNPSGSTPGTDAFNVSLVSLGGDRWSVYVYEDGGALELAVQNVSDGSPTLDVCGPISEPARIDLTRGTVNGEPCGALVFGNGISPGAVYDIEFRRGDHIQGTYNLTVNTATAGTSVESQNFETVASGTSPYEVPAIYSAHVDVHYVTADLRYRAEVRIARGEPP